MSPEVDWRALLEALVRVEQLREEDSGLLSFGPAPSGAVFVERGRICWVAAHGLQRRLRDLVLTRSNIDPTELERIYERCRAERRFFGQTLVDEGWIQASELEWALRRHSAESVVALCRGNQYTTWLTHRGPGYAPQFTFRASDILGDVVGLLAPEAQRAAEQELASLQGPGRRGGAFLFEPDTEIAVPLAGFGADQSLESACLLGRWASAVPLATKELGGAQAFALAVTAAGDTVAVWSRQDLLFAIVCEERESIAALTARFLNARAEDAQAEAHCTPSNSTSNKSVAFGGITPPAPRAP